MKIVQLNTTLNSGSHGRIASQIGDLLLDMGNESYIVYGRTANTSRSTPIKVGSTMSILMHVFVTRAFDLHGFASKAATRSLIKQLHKINPDIIHIHNIHGYYINIKLLFEYLKDINKPVVWTLHDCWPFTGHCSYFDSVNCMKWHKECYKCPIINSYPASVMLDNSRSNFRNKKKIFSGIEKMVMVTPSEWLASHLKDSFLSNYPVKVINNGIDLDRFDYTVLPEIRKRYNFGKLKIILGVASIWDKRKGFDDFLRIRSMLNSEYHIILVGLSNNQLRNLPEGISGIKRTENVEELAGLYSMADIFVNPTYSDNFPTTNLEALACGTPVITYDTGGSSEAIDKHTGKKVDKGDLAGLVRAIEELTIPGRKDSGRNECRNRALSLYNQKSRFADYVSLYEELYNNKQ